MGIYSLSRMIGTGLVAMAVAGAAGAQTTTHHAPAGAADQAATVQPPAPAQPPRKPSIGARSGFPEVREPVRREVAATPRRSVQKKRQRPNQAAAAPQPAPQQQSPSAAPPSPAVVAPVAGVATAGAAVAGAPAGAASDQPAAPQQAQPQGWSPDEIKLAKLHCDGQLRGVPASYAIDDPIKEGECGSPVVYKVMSVGKGPEVQLNPPAVMTCEMIAALEKWIRLDIQPQARALLGGSVVRIETMSSYSCRNAYGRVRARLSEHGRANALDISGFSTAKDVANVLAHWGPTARELRVIAAKQEAERAAAATEAAKASERSQQTTVTGSTPTQPIPGIIIAPMPGASRPHQTMPGFTAPQRLGGPQAKGKETTAAIPVLPEAGAKGDPRRSFLREIHARACKHFGTVLGPEANNAHKNHFHVDMAPRRNANFCE